MPEGTKICSVKISGSCWYFFRRRRVIARTYQTYTKTNQETGEVYSGKTSETGTPEENVAARDSGRQKNAEGVWPQVNDPIKRQKRKSGDFVQINLDGGFHSYARVLGEAQFAFYDSRTTNDWLVDRISASAILFSVAVMNHAVTRGRWKIVGHIPLEEALLVPRPRFMQDALNPHTFSIYERGAIRPATRERNASALNVPRYGIRRTLKIVFVTIT